MKFNVSYLNNGNNISETREISLDGESALCSQLDRKISESFNVGVDDFDIYYGSTCLQYTPKQPIRDLGVKPGTKLYVVQKKIPAPKKETETLDYSSVRNAAFGLHTMFQHSQPMRRRHKSPIMKLFEDRETMDSIIASVDGLAEDQAAIDILENIKLFEVMVDPKNVKNILEKHPCLANAFVAMWNSLMSSSRYSNFDPISGAASGSQESMDVDSSQFLSPPGGSQQSSSSRRAASQARITSSQLADAIALATSPGGAMFPYSAYNTPTPSNTQSPMPNQSRSATGTPSSASVPQMSRPRQNIITPDVFSQAMQQALMSTGLQQVAETLQSDPESGATSTISEDAMRTGLEQMRAMGISDEEACRQALTATQGNVEAAINIIFGSG